ncbi:MAG: SH3 domain-containing protein, partial [Nitrospirota bacterium]|nr:SH3 domain-containing protein [Nitrospirota bacterium]
MRSLTLAISLFGFLFLGQVSFADAHDFQIGQSVVLRATKPIGVPLHRKPAPSYLKHVPGDTTAIIEHISKNAQWIRIRFASGETGWVHAKYAEPASSVPTSTGPKPDSPDSP